MTHSKTILVSSEGLETRVAILEDGVLAEYYVEDSGLPRVRGNIYLGTVRDVLPGMEAAFVDIGLDRNAFLYVQDIPGARSQPFSSKGKPITSLLKQGQSILVQVSKPPVAGKGARVTGNITLAGRKLVLMPENDTLGVSKKLDEAERERLLALLKEIKPPEMGLIVRTAGEGAGREELAADLEYLLKVWKLASGRAARKQPPVCVYTELSLASSIVRDVFTAEYESLLVDDKETHEEVSQLVRSTSPELLDRVVFYDERSTPLFEKYGLETQIATALGRKVWLRSGGYITIDRTEALTAIDVNTGKYTGGKNLEETVYRTNLEAAGEIARQVRLRDIGGIIVIDFIDMTVQEERKAVFERLSNALKRDRAKSRVVDISRIGLVEMTRKNFSQGLVSHYFDTCPTCAGAGRISSSHRSSVEAAHKIVRMARQHEGEWLLFGVSPRVMDELGDSSGEKIDKLSRQTGKKLRLYAATELSEDEVMLAAEGGEEDVEHYLAHLRH